jgi:hypothetical protein
MTMSLELRMTVVSSGIVCQRIRTGPCNEAKFRLCMLRVTAVDEACLQRI